MQYYPLSRSTVKITLSEDELREYSLCSENLSLRTAETKRGLARLLKKLRLFAGCKAERLFLEAFPSSDGGCVLYVSSLAADESCARVSFSQTAARESVRQYEIMCFVDTMEQLISLCAGLSRQCVQPQSCAYACDGGYFLILSGRKRDTDTAERLMNEYGGVSDDFVSIRSVAERGRLICDDAVNRLALLF